MNIQLKIHTAIFFAFLVLISCQKNKETAEPDSGISVVTFTATPSPVDFSTSDVNFDASFSGEAEWQLTIIGKQSGAVRQYRGKSADLKGLRWNGTHDQSIPFVTGETAVATISFPGGSNTSSMDIVISKALTFVNTGTELLYGNFESVKRIAHPYWEKISIAQTTQGVDSVAVDYNGQTVPGIEDKKYYFMKGTGTDPVFVTGLRYIGNLSPALPAEPSNVWLNVYVYGTGNPQASLNIECQESDADGSMIGYQGNDDDAYIIRIRLGHKGWRLFSFRYSSLMRSNNPAFGGSGNNTYEPQGLKNLMFMLMKESNPDAPVEVYFDYPILTVGGPYKP